MWQAHLVLQTAANAAIEHMRDWVKGTEEGDWVSMAVYSEGEYGVEKGIIFSTLFLSQW